MNMEIQYYNKIRWGLARNDAPPLVIIIIIIIIIIIPPFTHTIMEWFTKARCISCSVQHFM
jgi:hypothetical protein